MINDKLTNLQVFNVRSGNGTIDIKVIKRSFSESNDYWDANWLESEMKVTGFECCFCKKNIIENEVDPIDISVVFNKDVKNKTDSFQVFYSHFICFKNRLHTENQGYFIIDDE